MPDQPTAPEPAKPAAEARGVLALIAGAVAFYVCIAVVALITDRLLPSFVNSDSTISGTYIVAWILGAGISSAVGVEVAKWILPAFNRIGFIVLAVLPIALYVVGLLAFGGQLSLGQLEASICALIGTIIGLGMTLRDLWARDR
jgi:hypothetical protein